LKLKKKVFLIFFVKLPFLKIKILKSKTYILATKVQYVSKSRESETETWVGRGSM
jgi:hypothetical protein